MTTLAGRAFQCTTVLGKKTVLTEVGRGGDLLAHQRVDEFGLPAVGYKIFRDWNCNKVICDLVQHNKATIYASLIKWAPIEV